MGTARWTWTAGFVLVAALLAGLMGTWFPDRTVAADAPSTAYLLASADGFLYAYGAEPGPNGVGVPVLHVADIRGSGGPRWLGSTVLPGWAASLAAAGGRVYAGGGEGGLWVIDATDPTRPSVVGTYPTAGRVRGLATDGARVVATDWGRFTGAPATWQPGGLHVVDVADPAHPRRASFVELGDAGVALAGPLAHVAGSGVRIVDVSAPTAAVVGAYEAPPLAGDSENEYPSVAAAGRYVYLSYRALPRAGPRVGLDVLDVAEPGHPTLAGRLTGQGGYVDVLRPAGDGYAFRMENQYYPSFTRTLRVYALGARCPTPAAAHVPGEETVDALVVGTVLYAATGPGGLQVLPLTDARPTPTPFAGRVQLRLPLAYQRASALNC